MSVIFPPAILGPENGGANFMGVWQSLVHSAGKLHAHKIPCFRGGGLEGGGVGANFILWVWAFFRERVLFFSTRKFNKQGSTPTPWARGLRDQIQKWVLQTKKTLYFWGVSVLRGELHQNILRELIGVGVINSTSVAPENSRGINYVIQTGPMVVSGNSACKCFKAMLARLKWLSGSPSAVLHCTPREATDRKLQMLLSPRKNRLDSFLRA